MVAKPDSLKHRNTHIPASVQQSMAQHIERTMPHHLKKFQQGGYIPKHAEKAISQHVQKSLPGHLKKYADPYVQQNIMWGNNVTSPATSKASSAYRPYSPTSSNQSNVFDRQIFASDSSRQSAEEYVAPADTSQGGQDQQPQSSGDNYDFIMNQNPGNKSPLFAPENTKMRIAIFGVGIILLIILMIVFFSFLNAAGSKQKDNLLKVAQTQAEIIRVIKLGEKNISTSDLKDKTLTLQAVIATSQQEVIAALAARGEKANPKDLAKTQNPQTDAELENALAQARHDEAFNKILLNLLEQYSSQLNNIYNEGNASEKELATDAYNQIDLIFDLDQSTGSEDQVNDQQSQAVTQ